MKNYIKNLFPFLLLLIAISAIGSACQEPIEQDPEPEDSCEAGIEFKLDNTLIQFNDAQVTAEIHNDAAIGKFYDIWTDENVSDFNGFYFHSTITETDEVSGFSSDWFVTNDVANIVFLNNKDNVNMQFRVIQGASAVGDRVVIHFSGSYEENGIPHQITEGVICTTIDIVN